MTHAFIPATAASRRTFLRQSATVAASAAGLSLLSPTAFAQGAGKPASVRIGPLQDPNYLTLIQLSGGAQRAVAKASGQIAWLPAFPAFAPTAEALRGGSIDVGAGSTTSFLSALGGQKDLVVYAVESDSGKGQGIVATGGIRSIEDLVGKKVAVNRGGTGEYLLRLALAKRGIPFDKVTPVHLGPTDGATAFLQGHVQAWAVWDQFFATGQTAPGAHVVAYGADIGSQNRIVHVTTRRFAEQQPALLKALYDALVAEAQAAQSKPGWIADLNAERGVPKAVTEVIRKIPPAGIVPADEKVAKEFAEVAQFLFDQKLSKTLIDVKGVTLDASKLG